MKKAYTIGTPETPNTGLIRVKAEAKGPLLERAAQLSLERGLAKTMPIGTYLEEASAFFEAHRKKVKYAR
jgi:hypothetical protein